MEHLNTFSIPVFYKSMMTIELHLISFTVVVSLVQNSGAVNILGVPNLYILDKKRGWVWSFFNFFYVIKEFFILLSVPLMPVVLLIEGNYAKSFRIFCLFYNRFYRLDEL